MGPIIRTTSDAWPKWLLQSPRPRLWDLQSLWLVLMGTLTLVAYVTVEPVGDLDAIYVPSWVLIALLVVSVAVIFDQWLHTFIGKTLFDNTGLDKLEQLLPQCDQPEKIGVARIVDSSTVLLFFALLYIIFIFVWASISGNHGGPPHVSRLIAITLLIAAEAIYISRIGTRFYQARELKALLEKPEQEGTSAPGARENEDGDQKATHQEAGDETVEPAVGKFMLLRIKTLVLELQGYLDPSLVKRAGCLHGPK